MQLFYGIPEDMEKWMSLVTQVRWNYAQSTGRNFYSFGWMLDIARCVYTLRTGKIIAKTEAAEWALENNLCPEPDALKYALKVHRSPLEYKDDKQTFDYAETLAEPIQRFANVLEKELIQTIKGN